MARFHFIFGTFLFVVFLITGQFMGFDFPDKDIIPQELRLLMRSRHIYILFSALIHVGLGLYFRVANAPWRRRTQFAGSFLLVTSSFLLVWGFVAETYFYAQFSEISRFGIYASLAGVSLHTISRAGQRTQDL